MITGWLSDTRHANEWCTAIARLLNQFIVWCIDWSEPMRNNLASVLIEANTHFNSLSVWWSGFRNDIGPVAVSSAVNWPAFPFRVSDQVSITWVTAPACWVIEMLAACVNHPFAVAESPFHQPSSFHHQPLSLTINNSMPWCCWIYSKLIAIESTLTLSLVQPNDYETKTNDWKSRCYLNGIGIITRVRD